MSSTYPLVSFGLDDYKIKNAISSLTTAYGVTQKQSFCDLTDLQYGRKTVVPFATFEPDYWILDGNHHFMPTSPTIGLMANALSDGSGNIPSNVVLSIFFTSVQSLRYLSIFFDIDQGEWCSSIKVDFWTSGGVMLWGGTTVTPTSVEYDVDAGSIITGVDHVNITLYKTNHAYRFARLTAIDFGANGKVTHLDGTKIKSATITEEFSPITATLTANSLELDLLLDTSDFSIVDPASPYVNLSDGMPFTVYEVLDNVSNLMGIFYLQDWDNGQATDRIIKFNCLDIIGIAAKLPFYGWVNGVDGFTTIMDYVIGLAKLSYDYESAIGSYTFNTNDSDSQSYIEPGSMRDFIQKVSMALRLGVTTRNGKIHFSTMPAYKIPAYMSSGDEYYSILISNEKINRVNLLPLVTSIKFVRTLTDGGGGVGLVTAYTASLAAGNYIVTFPDMRAGGPTISGGTFNSPAFWGNQGAWAYDFHVSSPGTVTIQDYDSKSKHPVPSWEKTTFLQIVSGLPIERSVEIDSTVIAGDYPSAFLPGTTRDAGQVQWIADYYSSRYSQESTVYKMIVHAGDLVKIDSVSGKQILGIIEKANITLVGLRSDITVVGKVL